MKDWQVYFKKTFLDIKMDLRETGYGEGDWIKLAYDGPSGGTSSFTILKQNEEFYLLGYNTV
jgi:hypothetical protein